MGTHWSSIILVLAFGSDIVVYSTSVVYEIHVALAIPKKPELAGIIALNKPSRKHLLDSENRLKSDFMF